MLKIYSERDFEPSFIEALKKDSNYWDYDTRELGYLLDGSGEPDELGAFTYVLITGDDGWPRLQELAGCKYSYYLKNEEADDDDCIPLF